MYVSVSKCKSSRFLLTPKSWIVQITLEFPLRTCEKHHSITFLFTKSYTHVIYAYDLTVTYIYIDCYINYLINFSSFEIMYNLQLDLNNKKVKVSGWKRFSTINVPLSSVLVLDVIVNDGWAHPSFLTLYSILWSKVINIVSEEFNYFPL